MQGKVSRLNLLKPQTATFYERAIRDVYQSYTQVMPKHYTRFNKLETSLHNRYIYPKDYAYDACESMVWWVQKYAKKHLPSNVFCAEWVVEMVEKRVGERVFQTPNYEEERLFLLVSQELVVARRYIDCLRMRKTVTFTDVVEELRPVLSDEWLQLFQNKRRTSLEVHAVNQLCLDHGVDFYRYEDFVRI